MCMKNPAGGWTTQEHRHGCPTLGMLRPFGAPSGVCGLGPTSKSLASERRAPRGLSLLGSNRWARPPAAGVREGGPGRRWQALSVRHAVAPPGNPLPTGPPRERGHLRSSLRRAPEGQGFPFPALLAFVAESRSPPAARGSLTAQQLPQTGPFRGPEGAAPKGTQDPTAEEEQEEGGGRRGRCGEEGEGGRRKRGRRLGENEPGEAEGMRRGSRARTPSEPRASQKPHGPPRRAAPLRRLPGRPRPERGAVVRLQSSWS
uniref:dapper homolog 3-like n=1 Tax=Callithrix jacchus TaxID=9483 RepID=UPI0023DD5AAE|nr:dapper homolog 3-like [Callithrix jacchus]